MLIHTKLNLQALNSNNIKIEEFIYNIGLLYTGCTKSSDPNFTRMLWSKQTRFITQFMISDRKPTKI